MRIISLTVNPTIDMAARTDKVNPEAKLRCGGETFDPGGGGINVARAIQKLGGEAVAVFTKGGADGMLLHSFLQDESVTSVPVSIENHTRRNITITESDGKTQYRFVFPGPEIHDKEAEDILSTLKNESKDAAYVVLSGSLPPGLDDNFYSEAVKILSDMNCRIVVDTSGEPLKSITREKVFLIKPNLRELQYLTGEEFKNEAHLKKTAKDLLEKSNIENIVVSLGRGGALLVNDSVNKHFRAPIVPVKSKVGAGDSMVAGIVLALTEKKNLPDAVLFGLAAGAAAAMTPGIELCRNDDARSIYDGLKDSENNDFLAE